MKNSLNLLSISFALACLTGYQALGQVIDVGDAGDFSKSLAVAPGGKLTMNVDCGDVHIVGAEQTTVDIHVERKVTHASEADAARILKEEHVVLKLAGNEVSLTAQEPPSLHRKSWWGWWNQPNLNVHYEITVPRRFNAEVDTAGGDVKAASLNGDVNIRTSGGDLDCENIEGKVNGQTQGGDVKATRLKGSVNLKTMGGNLVCENVDGDMDGQTMGGNVRSAGCDGQLRLKTMGGNVTIDGFAGPDIHASTEGGSVSAAFNVAPKSDCELETEGGNVTVRLPGNAAVMLDARTEGGAVKTDLPVQVEGELSGSSLKGTINGGGPLLKLKTEGGNIEVLKQ